MGKKGSIGRTEKRARKKGNGSQEQLNFTFFSASVASWNFELNASCSSWLSWSTRCFSSAGTLGFCWPGCTTSLGWGIGTGRGGLPGAPEAICPGTTLGPCVCWVAGNEKNQETKSKDKKQEENYLDWHGYQITYYRSPRLIDSAFSAIQYTLELYRAIRGQIFRWC